MLQPNILLGSGLGPFFFGALSIQVCKGYQGSDARRALYMVSGAAIAHCIPNGALCRQKCNLSCAVFSGGLFLKLGGWMLSAAVYRKVL